MSTRAKLSCLSWDKQSKNIIASSDYEGIVTVWDVNRGQVSHNPMVSKFYNGYFSGREIVLNDNCRKYLQI